MLAFLIDNFGMVMTALTFADVGAIGLVFAYL
jgi:hypothetical protein